MENEIIENLTKSLTEAWDTIERQEGQIERLKSIVNDLRCGIQATRDMLDDSASVADEGIVF